MNLSSYENLHSLEIDILEVLDRAMTEQVTQSEQADALDSHEHEQSHEKDTKSKGRKSFINNIYFQEAFRLKIFVQKIFEQAKQVDFNFKPDYTDKICNYYILSLQEYLKDLNENELVNDHVKWIMH